MRTRLYLDTRNRDTSRPCPLYLCIARRGETAFFPLDVYILPARWDAKARRLRQLPASVWAERPTIAKIIDAKASALELEIMKGEAAGEPHGLSALGVRDWLRMKTQPVEQKRTPLVGYIEHLAEQRTSKESWYVWQGCARALREFDPSVNVEDVDVRFLRAFSLWLEGKGYKRNSVVTRLCTLRSATRIAISEGVITSNPFTRFPLRIEETRKRSLSAAQMRQAFGMKGESVARDYFLLSFLLLGMNAVDMFNAKREDFDGERLHYRRSKTKKLYDVKVFPEAAEILERRRGSGEFLFDARERWASVASFTGACDVGVKALGKEWGEVSMYWARHSWATIAANDCDIPQDVISHALGHSTGVRVTQTYVNFDLRKVDAANRAVIDFVLGK